MALEEKKDGSERLWDFSSQSIAIVRFLFLDALLVLHVSRAHAALSCFPLHLSLLWESVRSFMYSRTFFLLFLPAEVAEEEEGGRERKKTKRENEVECPSSVRTDAVVCHCFRFTNVADCFFFFSAPFFFRLNPERGERVPSSFFYARARRAKVFALGKDRSGRVRVKTSRRSASTESLYAILLLNRSRILSKRTFLRASCLASLVFLYERGRKPRPDRSSSYRTVFSTSALAVYTPQVDVCFTCRSWISGVWPRRCASFDFRA